MKRNIRKMLISILMLGLLAASCSKAKEESSKSAKETATEFVKSMTEGDIPTAKSLATEESAPIIDELVKKSVFPDGATFEVKMIEEGDSVALAEIYIAGEVDSVAMIQLPDGRWLISYKAEAPVVIRPDKGVEADTNSSAPDEME